VTRRIIPLIGLAAVLATAQQAFPADRAAPIVRVRVEGKTTTIFGATEPRARASTALEALDVAGTVGEFYVHVQNTDYGPYVDQIGRYPGAGPGGWVFKVNGVSPPVGADKLELKAGDVVLWYWATFTQAGGPPTLALARDGRNCYRVSGLDDSGKTVGVSGATLRVGGRAVALDGGRGCVGAHRALVRATAPGTVRSNALP
jgi:hypothetical protein